jgi:hydrogenase-4 component E
MSEYLNLFLVGVLLINFGVLTTTRLRAVINFTATQGALLGLAYPLAHLGVEAPLSPSSVSWQEEEMRLIGLSVVMILIKTFIIPRILLRAMRRAAVSERMESTAGVLPVLLIGALGTGLAVAYADALPLRSEHSASSRLLVPTALATGLSGFLMLTTRRQALGQVLGYILLENGIFTFGLLLVNAVPMLVEVGVLLDLFVGVFVMGIIIHHVSRAFPEASSEHLSALRE